MKHYLCVYYPKQGNIECYENLPVRNTCQKTAETCNNDYLGCEAKFDEMRNGNRPILRQNNY